MCHRDSSGFLRGPLVVAVLSSIGAMTGVVSGQTITEFPIPTVLSTTSGSITDFPLSGVFSPGGITTATREAR